MTSRRKSREIPSLVSFIKTKWPNMLRLAGFLLVVYLIGLAIVARQVRAETSEMMLGVGAEMMRFANPEYQDEPRTLLLNGQRLGFASGHSTEHTVADVLDFFEGRCAEHSLFFADVPELLASASIDAPDTGMWSGTLREGGDGAGYVACFDTGEVGGVEGVLHRLEAFTDSGNLAELGGLRYAYASRTAEGTHFIVFYTDESLNIYDMFPATGDAPGMDVPGLPRPRAARRMLSAYEADDPHVMGIYTSTSMLAEDMQTWYRAELPRQGWSLVDPSDEDIEDHISHWSAQNQVGARGRRFMLAEKDGRQVMLLFADDSEGHQGVATVLSTR